MATKTSKRQEQLAKVAGVRAHVGPAAAGLTDSQLLEIIAICGSVGLATDALTMIPWPRWLERLAER